MQERDQFKKLLLPISIILCGLLITISILFLTKQAVDKEAFITEDTLKKYIVASLTGDYSGLEAETSNKITVSMDDDPVLGDKSKAKVAIVEFSDYECPFCKVFYDETYKKLKEEYVDSGKAILVFRDLPLNIHNPLAMKQAIAAQCAHKYAGNEKYFQYHDLIFENTKSNGNGLEEAKLYEFADKLNIDKEKFKSCYESEEFKDEVNKDISAANEIGIYGTPGFVIGKFDNEGNVKGVVIKGAQTYEFMKGIIDKEIAS